jgi:hypothetical protein
MTKRFETLIDLNQDIIEIVQACPDLMQYSELGGWIITGMDHVFQDGVKDARKLNNCAAPKITLFNVFLDGIILPRMIPNLIHPNYTFQLIFSKIRKDYVKINVNYMGLGEIDTFVSFEDELIDNIP